MNKNQVNVSKYQVIKEDIRFDSGETYCSAWLFLPKGVTKPPVVVLGHGIGAIREMRLDAFAERFAQAGIAALAFTYRYLGDSGGEPRQLMSVNRQLDDWEAALKFVKSYPSLDGERVGIWGSSFGGGHAITIASRHPELKAAIAQCPFTDGLASASALGLKDTLKVIPVVTKDLFAKLFGLPPVMVPIAAPPGQPALMNAHDALEGYLALMPEGVEFVNHLTARIIPEILRYRPGLVASKIQSPILFCVSDTDTVTPAGQTLKLVKHAPRGVIKRYEAGHFDFYTGEAFEQLVNDQTQFLKQNFN